MLRQTDQDRKLLIRLRFVEGCCALLDRADDLSRRDRSQTIPQFVHFYARLDLGGIAVLLDPRSESREDDDASFGSLVGDTTMQGLLGTLTEDQRNTLNLHFLEGYTFDEIAAKLDQSLGKIRNHYYRGLDKLRKQMFPGKLPGRNGYGRK